MKAPFNVLDFLDRAEHVDGERVGVIDEPDQPARVGAHDLERRGSGRSYRRQG